LAKFFYKIKQEDIDRPIIPVGKPISGAQALILDSDQKKCRVGKRGEIYIRTPFITSGYYNDPGLNKKRFIKNPYGENSRDIIFKTGDLGRLFPDGNIELSGRIDQQVKIRGFRIEPGEIENRLLTHKDIKEAVVIAHENKEGEKYLCAYVISDKVISPCIRELREYLSGELPDYMVPSHFVQLKEIPLTSNGKVDRKKFQAPPLPGMTQPETYIAPRDEIEKKLRDMWTDVLNIPKEIIGIDSNFFDLGGHSLKAALFRAKMHHAFNISVPLEKIFKSPCIRELSGYIKGARQDEFISIEAAEKKEFYELSYNQKRLWLLSQLDPGSPAYHISRGITLRYRVNEKVLEKVFSKLTARHESLRTCFAEVDHAPVQFIRKHVDLPFEIIDISLLKGEEQEKQKERLIAEMQASPFDLAVPPLSRALLVKSHEEEYTLAITMHHIISDGWSMEILEQEFQRLYEGYLNHKEIELETREFQYKDFTTWHNKWLNNPAFKEKSHRFWKEKLDNIDAFPILELTKNSAAANKSSESAAYCFVLNKEQKNKLVQLARDNNATLFTVMFSVFNMMLANFSGQREIVCGIPAAGREHISLQNIMGFFVNTLVLKTHVDHDEFFTDFIKRVSNDHLKFLHHQGYPLELVLDDLNMKFPGIPVFFNMLNMHDAMVKKELAVTHPFHIEKVRDVKFDIVLYSSEYKNGIEIQCHYRRALFKPEAVEHIIGEYVKLLDFVGDNSTRSIKDYKHSKRRRILNRSINISRGLRNAG
jgi:acyl carrier protein